RAAGGYLCPGRNGGEAGESHFRTIHISLGGGRVMSRSTQQSIPRISIDTKQAAPRWALLERQLFEALNQAAAAFVKRYAREDGTLIWRNDWPGMDGSDDPYEGFMYLSLLYTLGGSDEVNR